MKKVYLFAGTAIFCWSTMATITKLMLGNTSGIQLLWISSLLAGLFLLGVNLVKGNFKKLKEYKAKDYFLTALTGIPGTFLYYVFYYAGAERLPASQAFIINYLWPMMSVVFACIILKEKLTLRKVVAILVSFLGVCIVAGGDGMQLDGNILIGAIFCALGAVFYGVFTAMNQKMSYDKELTMMIGFFLSFLITTVMNGISGDLFLPTFAQWLGFGWNGIVSMAVGCTLWVIALDYGNTAKLSNLAYITPFLSLVWTSLILKEEITVNAVVGLVVIMLGILIQLKKSSKEL